MTRIAEFLSETRDSFGWRGFRDHRGVEMIWRWDSARKM